MHDDESTGPMPGVEVPAPRNLPGVGEVRTIPVFVNGVEQSKCSPGRELGPGSSSYSCMDKADRGMFLDRGGTQPGPSIAVARNDKGTDWLLLCRKVADNGTGMMKTHTFTDMAMIGHNPRTGRTCFFQNSIGSGIDGKHVPHPGDVEKSTTIWSSNVQAYCSGSCHAESAFVHSPWIDGAKRNDGKAIVPKMGELNDYLISDLSAPYSIIAGDKLGFKIPQQLVSEEAAQCTTCHRLAGNTLKDFAEWTTGSGEEYQSKLTDFGKKFDHNVVMPPRKEGLTEANFRTSPFGLALAFMKNCANNPNDAACVWADVPRGEFNNPRPNPQDR
jgi:cytochrome c553